MEISTGIVQTEDGVLQVCLQADMEDGLEPVVFAMTPDIAREVAFGLMEQADELDPPAWREQ